MNQPYRFTGQGFKLGSHDPSCSGLAAPSGVAPSLASDLALENVRAPDQPYMEQLLPSESSIDLSEDSMTLRAVRAVRQYDALRATSLSGQPEQMLTSVIESVNKMMTVCSGWDARMPDNKFLRILRIEINQFGTTCAETDKYLQSLLSGEAVPPGGDYVEAAFVAQDAREALYAGYAGLKKEFEQHFPPEMRIPDESDSDFFEKEEAASSTDVIKPKAKAKNEAKKKAKAKTVPTLRKTQSDPGQPVRKKARVDEPEPVPGKLTRKRASKTIVDVD